MELRREKNGYLYWKGLSFGSDGITASFRYKDKKAEQLLAVVKESVDDYSKFMGDFLSKGWSIGGEIIWPSHPNNINEMRGMNPYIKDRWDLTIECIRRYYKGEKSPLPDVSYCLPGKPKRRQAHISEDNTCIHQRAGQLHYCYVSS